MRESETRSRERQQRLELETYHGGDLWTPSYAAIALSNGIVCRVRSRRRRALTLQ